MPEIQLKHIVSCSSEDRNNPADNLLKAEGTHKWRTAAPGEKNATVVIQFEKASQVTGIDIGNEGSAFVEVLVGKSTSSSEYQVLLVSSSFMTPADSRSGSNRNSVRMFSLDKLSKTAAPENWDRVKIVCTQPFNKSTTYGLSFIKFHTGSDSSKTSPKEGVKKLGAFFIKKDDDDDDDNDIKVGSLFANKGKRETTATTTTTTPKPSPALTGAAAVRAASRQLEEARLSSSSLSSPSSPSNSRPSTSRASSQNAERDPAAAKVVKEEEGDTDEDLPAPRTSLKRQSTSLSSSTSSTSATSSRASHPLPLKKTRTEPPKPSPEKEFSRLMEGVTFALSGFQNPYRAELREKALEMGATYKPDWGRGCTHLICAFTNTPKYNQVKGRGRIVSKQWVTDCHRQKRLLPWRKYRLGDAESPGGSSEEEEEITPRKKNTTATPNKPPPSSSSKGNAKATPIPKQTKAKTTVDSDDNQYAGDTDSADDTDEEIRRATNKAKAKTAASPKPAPEPKVNKPKVKVTKPDPDPDPDPALEIFADSTDEDDGGGDETNDERANSRVGGGGSDGGGGVGGGDDDDQDDDGSLPDLPDFFVDKHFFFYGDFAAAEKRLLTRYIAAYDGVLEDYMTDRVKYVITSAAWDDNFDQAVSEHPGLVFIRPQWIHSCHDKAALISYKPFTVHK